MPVCRILAIITLLLAGVLVTSGPARSELILENDPIFGPNSLVLDTSTGLEWLNLRFSTGLSSTEVIAELQSTGKFSGFRYATLEEFTSLATNFFSQQICCFEPLDISKTKEFVNLFGPTLITSDFSLLSGFLNPFFDNTDICGNWLFYQTHSELPGAYDQDCGFTISTSPRPFMGSYLVRTVSEPASITLLYAGFLALLILKRNARLQ